jgi:hypothetical protein
MLEPLGSIPSIEKKKMNTTSVAEIPLLTFIFGKYLEKMFDDKYILLTVLFIKV